MKDALEMDVKLALLLDSIKTQFDMRTIDEGKKVGINFDIKLKVENKHRSIWLTFSNKTEEHTINVPIPFVENGIHFIENNNVRRALCNYYFINKEKEVDFIEVLQEILLGCPTGIIPSFMIKNISSLQQIIYSFVNGNASVITHSVQKAINYVVNIMPLHETNMNSYIMNQRLIMVDPDFEDVDKLNYQVEKAVKFFDRGWSTIGLSDGVMADKNYILKEDLRRYTPFGYSFHNPQRNLYSSLCMKGNEEPLVRTQSMEILRQKGITRKGWNLFTVFVDIPDVWEDQILLDNSLKKLGVTYTKRIQCFGDVTVKKGDVVKKGSVICKTKTKENIKISFDADEIKVKDIYKTVVNIGGNQTEASNIVVEYKRKLKDGVKITNMAANKGVIRFKNLGYAVDPRNGESKQIQVLVSCKAVEKRKNYTQILEALFNNVTGNKGAIVKDDVVFDIKVVEDRLSKEGFPKDGTWMCHTYIGEFEAVAGTVFWGVTKDVEDQLWEENDTIKVNNRNLRVAGLKFSHVEFRGLMTRFGKENPIIDEIMSYAQGAQDIGDLLSAIRSQKNEFDAGVEEVDVRNLKPVDLSNGAIFERNCFIGSVVDETVYPNGFILKLPVKYQTVQNAAGEITFEGMPIYSVKFPPEDGAIVFETDRVYIPSSSLRSCWMHPSGKYGFSEVGNIVNNVVEMSHRYINDPEKGIHLTMLYQHISKYFNRVSNILGTKRGEISVHGMSVRYPFSAKAVATLSNGLPKNTIQIHKEMAEQLNIQNNDVVLVERFPCLGFMSIRPQKVMISNDPMCRYTIRVSGNSLTSLGLDFDGDVIYVASFHTEKAKECLRKEWENPNKSCYDAIKILNEKSGKPHFKEMSLYDYKITPFKPLTNEEHAECVSKLTGVKANTGPVIALAYNIMRIIENSEIKDSQKVAVAVEVFLDRVGNSVFKQKHGVKSLHKIVTEAICTANVKMLVDEGFDQTTSQMICEEIRKQAFKIGVRDLKNYHNFVSKFGTNIINKLIRLNNKIYFASRAQLHGINLLDCLDSPAVDVPSKLFKWIILNKDVNNKTPMDCHLEEKFLSKCTTEDSKQVCKSLFSCLDYCFNKALKPKQTDNNIDEKICNDYFRMENIIKEGMKCSLTDHS